MEKYFVVMVLSFTSPWDGSAGGAALVLARGDRDLSRGEVEILSSSLSLPLGVLSILGLALLVAILLAALYVYVRALQPKEVARPRSLLLIGTILLIVFLLTRYGLVVINALSQSFPHIPFSAMRAALPIPLGGVLLTVLFNSRLAFAGALSLTILTGLMLAAPLDYFMFTFVGSLVGIFAIAGRQERTAFFRAGGAIGLASPPRRATATA